MKRRDRHRFPLRAAMGLAFAIVIAACEPTSAPFRSRIPTTTPTPAPPSGLTTTALPIGGATAGSSAGPGATAQVHPSGSPSVAISGTTITILGRGDKNSPIFPVDGTYKVTSSPCPGTGVIPFVWVYEEFGTSHGTYVDAEFTVKNLKGNFYLRISGPGTCDWTVTMTKQ